MGPALKSYTNVSQSLILFSKAEFLVDRESLRLSGDTFLATIRQPERERVIVVTLVSDAVYSRIIHLRVKLVGGSRGSLHSSNPASPTSCSG